MIPQVKKTIFVETKSLMQETKNQSLLPMHRKIVVGVQFLFVAFGATVLVPLLVGLDPSVALFTAGVGTLVFHLVAKGKVPIFLGSSFAFIAPIQKATELYGIEGTLSGLVAVGFVYFGMSALVKWKGMKLIDKLFPAEVVGPVIILIGLSLAPVAVNMASNHWGLAHDRHVGGHRVYQLWKRHFQVDPHFCRDHSRIFGGHSLGSRQF